ncbi:MAG TPA: T9SS type A sorting domain-containing protein [bacterium]
MIIDDKACLIAEIADEKKVDNPTSWQLGQNYPNPFNSVTLIDYAVPEASHVKLMIYNLVGQKLITLVDEIKQPGYYRASWNGFDDRKRFVGSGVYIYKIEAGKYEATKKMVLLL